MFFLENNFLLKNINTKVQLKSAILILELEQTHGFPYVHGRTTAEADSAFVFVVRSSWGRSVGGMESQKRI